MPIKNICMLSTHGYFDPTPELGKTDTGGQVIYILQLVKSLVRLGYKVDIYTRWFDKNKKQIDPLPGCPSARVIRIPAGEWEFIPKEFIYDVLPELAENMIAFIRKNKLNYDLYHGHYVDAGIVTLDMAKAFSKPSFFTAHSLGAWKRERTGGDPVEMDKIYNFTYRINEELRIFQSVTAQTVTSIEEIGKLKELYDFESKKINFTPPGVDIHKFRPLKPGESEKETAIQLPADYIFMVSRIANPKGHDLILPAFKKVLKKFPNVELVIGGGAKIPGQEEKKIFKYIDHFIRDNHLEHKVHPVGGIPHETLPPYFRQARLFILPARYEPFGMTALEAMACQTPAVITKFSGVQENLTSGKNCLIVDPLNTEELAEAICKFLEDDALANKLAVKGKKIVHEQFSWEAIAGKFIKCYEKYAA